MDQKKVITLEDRIPKLRIQRKQRANRRLIFYLSFFFLLLLTIIYFQSSLSDVNKIEISGNYHVSKEAIINSSKLNERTSFWAVNKQAIEQAVTSLEEISEATVTKKFPTTIQIEVKEYSRVAYLIVNGKSYPILENGKLLDSVEASNKFPTDAPMLVDWETSDELAEMAAELSKLPESLINRISEIYFTPVEEDPLRITLYMNDGFHVSSTIRRFSEKIIAYPAIVRELDPTVEGIIHMKMNPYFEQLNVEEEHEDESEG